MIVDYGYFGFNLGALDNPDSMERVLVCAEQLGYESIWTAEHVVMIDPASSTLTLSAGVSFC